MLSGNLNIEVHKEPYFKELLFGSSREIVFSNSIGKTQANIEIFEPSIISRLFSDLKPKVVIKIGNDKIKDINDASIEFVAKIISSFNVSIINSQFNYPYQSEDFNRALKTGFVNTKDSSKTIIIPQLKEQAQGKTKNYTERINNSDKITTINRL